MQALYNMEFPLLLSTLKDLKKSESSLTSLVNATTIDLMCKLFSRDDYHNFAVQLADASDAENMLDFILQVLRDYHLIPKLDESLDIKRRESLNVTGIRIPAQHHIGLGGFGHVFKGEQRGDTVALKVLYKVDNNVAFCREALMWRSLCHKFVLPFIGIYRNESMGKFFLVSPYMKNGTLTQWRKKANPSIAEVEERMLQVAQGIEYIHSEGVVHGDLRGDNILLDNNLHVQIADFGLTRLSEATNTRSGALHVNFAAPELFGYGEGDDSEEDDDVPIKTQKSDVYAFGCLYYEIHFDAIPFAGKTDVQIMRLHFRGAHPPRLDWPPLNDGAWELIQTCWVREASKRPGINVVISTLRHLESESNNSFRTPEAALALTNLRLAAPTSPMRSSLYPPPNGDALSFKNVAPLRGAVDSFANGTQVGTNTRNAMEWEMWELFNPPVSIDTQIMENLQTLGDSDAATSCTSYNWLSHYQTVQHNVGLDMPSAGELIMPDDQYNVQGNDRPPALPSHS